MTSLTEVKAVLKGLIVSSPITLTIQLLNEDYKKTEGGYIPYKSLGFNSLEELCYSIPDTLKITGRGTGALVYPVLANKDSQAISNFSSLKNKNSRSVRRRRSNRRSNCGSSSRRSGYNSFQSRNDSFSNSFNSSQVKSNCDNVKSNNSYGFGKIDNSNGIFNGNQSGKYSNDYENRSRNEKSCNYNASSYGKREKENSSYGTNLNQSNSSTLKNKINFETSFTTSSTNDLTSSTLSLVSSTSHNTASKSNENTLKKQITNNILKKFVTLDQSKCTQDLTNSSLSLDSSISHNRTDPSKPGSGLISAYHEARRQLNLNNGDEENMSLGLENLKIDPKDDEKVPIRIRINFKRLIENYPEGIWCRELPNLYSDQFNSSFDYARYGYMSLAEMCCDLPEIFYCIQHDTGDFKLFDKSKPFNNAAVVTPKPIVVSQPSKVFTFPTLFGTFERKVEQLFPPEAVRFNEKLERQWIDNDVRLYEFIDIFITEVYDVSKFWILICTKECYGRIKKMMQEMQLFYLKKQDSLLIKSKKLIRIGLYCVVMHKNEYTRAIVVSSMCEDCNLIKVFCIDIGTIAKISMQKVFFLHRDYSLVPAQAIRARMIGVVPPKKNMPWTSNAITTFCKLVQNKCIVGQIIKIDIENKILDLHLIDTNTEEDIDIGKELVKAKVAIPETEVQENYTPDCIPLVENIYLFPTFYELENALVPTFEEMNLFKKHCIRHSIILPKYYMH